MDCWECGTDFEPRKAGQHFCAQHGFEQQAAVELVAALEVGGRGKEYFLEGVVEKGQAVLQAPDRAHQRPVRGERTHAVVDVEGVRRARPDELLCEALVHLGPAGPVQPQPVLA